MNVAYDLQPLTNYIVTVDFSAYSLDTDNGNMKGYYAKIMKIKRRKWMTLTMIINYTIKTK